MNQMVDYVTSNMEMEKVMMEYNILNKHIEIYDKTLNKSV